MMNLRTIFSATAAATLLVVGPGWALAGPNAHLGGDADGSASGAAQIVENGMSAEAIAESSARFDAELDAGDAPEAPSAPEAPEAPEAPQASAPELPEAPDAPEAPETPQAPDGEQAPSDGPQAPDAPAVPQPEAPALPEKPKGNKQAVEKGDSDGGVRAEGQVGVSGSVRGDTPPAADYDGDGSGSAEALGQRVATP
jgi:hypothetical protein